MEWEGSICTDIVVNIMDGKVFNVSNTVGYEFKRIQAFAGVA